MSLTSEYLKAKGSSGSNNLTKDYLSNRTTKKKKEDEEVRLAVAAPKNDDIAPVRSDRTWFQKSKGNIFETILGTGADTGLNLTTGIVGMGEKVVDALAWLAPAANQAMQAQNNPYYSFDIKQYRKDQEQAGEFIKKDLYDEEEVARKILSGVGSAAYLSSITQGGGQLKQSDIDLARQMQGGAEKFLKDDLEDYSVLGERSDALVQSAGQLAAQYGLSAVGVPWFVTSGVTSFGAETENALNQGATFEKAGASAAISAGAEVLSEKLFGGDLFVKGAGSDIATKYLSTAISNKTLRNLAKFGIDVTGEGVEEVFSQVMSNLGSSLYKEENLGEILFSEEALDEYLESFIGGGVLGGGMSGINAVQTKKSGKDYATGLTANEQKVVDSVYKDMLAEKDGKLSAKEKAKIYDDVLRKMDRGEISTEKIEELFGGDTFKTYQDTIAEEDASLKELSELYKGEELQQKVNDFLANSKRYGIQKQLSEEVSQMVSGDRLYESYMERGRRSQHYEADITQYDEKQRAVIQSAIDSGVLNNTRRSHEMVDLIAKIAADKGVTFDFTNNERIANSEYAVKDATVNGYVTADGHITLNVESAKYLNSTVGHELTHVLEGTELYSELQKTLFEYAKGRKSTNSRFQSEYHERLHNALNLYEGKEGYLGQEGYKRIQNEVAADLVGDYLFTDDAFIRKLSTENRNVFEKIYDEIKYLCKIVTAGSKEARELERVKKAFEDAYRGDGKAKGDTKYSISDKNIKDISTGHSYGESYYTMSYTQDGKVVGTLEYGEYDGQPNVKMVEVEPEYRRKGVATKLLQELQKKYPDTEIDFGMTTPDGTKLLESITYDVTDEAVVTERQKLKDLQAELDELQEKLDVLYDTDPLTEAQEAELHKLGDRWEVVYDAIRVLAEDVRGKKAKRTFVKTDAKYSLSDSEGKQLTPEQSEFFKDSKMRDEEGNLKVMYHGSQDAGFHVFDSRMSDDDTSFFFVDRNDVAATYSGTSETYAPVGFKTIEDANRFFAENGLTEYEVVEENGKYKLLDDGDEVATSDSLDTIYEEFRDWSGLGYGDANYKVYLNLKNPLVVDAEGRSWDRISYEFSQESYDRYQSLTSEEKTALMDLAADESDVAFSGLVLDAVTKAERNWASDEGTYSKAVVSAYEKLQDDFGKVDVYRLYDIATDGFSEESLKEYAVKHLTTRDYAEKAKSEGYDGVIFNNIHDNGGYSNGSEGAATVAIAFDSNQIKSVANTKPTTNPDIRYSLSEDSTGKKLSPAVQKRFSNSKVVDDDGNLKVVYHGTATGEFFTFDKAKGNVEGDFGSGFYFTDNEDDVSEHYEGGGPDFEIKVGQRADEIWNEEPDLEYEEAERRAREELYKGSHKFEVYLNIENPAIVGETILFTLESYYEQYNEEDYDSYEDYVGDVEQLLSDDIENIIWEIEKNVDIYSTDGIAEVLWEAVTEGGIGIEELKAKLNNLYLEDNNGKLVANEVARQIIESLGYDGVVDPTVSGKWNMDIEDGTTHYIVFKPNQIKAVTNENPTDNPDIRYSLSAKGEAPTTFGNYHVSGKDVMYTPEEVAPVRSDVANSVFVNELFPDDGVPVDVERENIIQRLAEIRESGKQNHTKAEVQQMVQEYTELSKRLSEIDAADKDRFGSIDDADAPPEIEAPYYEETVEQPEPDNPFEDRDWYEVGKRNVKAYMYENPEVKPFFQAEAEVILGELRDTVKGERHFNSQLHYDTGGEYGWTGTKRMTSDSIAEMKDVWGYTYAEIEKGLNAIIEDNGAENIAAAKKIEFIINDRLLNGYKAFGFDMEIPPNEDYIKLLNEKQITEYSKEAFDALVASGDEYAPPVEDIAPLAEATPDTDVAPIYQAKDPKAPVGQTTMFEPPKPNPKVATVLSEEVAAEKKKSGVGKAIVSQVVDKGMAVENLSLKTGNMELQAKYNSALPTNTEAKAQYFMENGAKGVKSLKDIMKAAENTGKSNEFCDYLYHVHNIDRMTLDKRFGVENKTVFGETVTADVSRKKVAQYEKANHSFKKMAEDVYAYNKHLRKLLVDSGVISQDTANLWEKMYPHYVPVRRVDSNGLNVSVPLDTNKTGVNAPIKRATGGSSDILPLFNTMAQRTEQTYRAIARNAFGIELKNTLGTTIDTELDAAGVDEVIDTIVSQDEQLLNPGTLKSNPTFTVFENGERVEFEITEELYDALKPAGKVLGYRNKAVNKVSNWRRNLLTTWNPVFALYRNPVKDLQEVAINSQHPVKTYLNIPKAIYEIAAGGNYATEYHQNGGKSNTYFDSRNNKFKAEDGIFKKTIGMPLRAVETAGEFIEEIPRLAEYIASRKDGRSVDRSMLDAARVTTNFAAGGDFTKFFNSHGFNFLNASVQGASQHVRNFREAKQQGLKGYVKVLAKYTVAGLPGIILNSLLWDDDEEYEELSDYVKQNYYVVAKTEDGKFVRIPKGRTAAVIQNAMEQMQNLVTGDDEVDFGTFYELFMNNIAPSNPVENNILAPVIQTLNNKAWYGGDLVPARLQDLPAAEQFDESTDSISKWLGEATNTSPYKWNYLIDQYSGGVGDVFLPMLTPEAESGDNTFIGNMLAPWKKELTTDSVLNNKNPGDFYDLKDELEIKTNSKDATEEDAMRSMYMDAVSWDMSDLYKRKREVQSSDLPDDEKYEEVRRIQEEINELANGALDGYQNVKIDGLYSEVGDRRFNKDAESGKWYEIQAKNSDGTDNYYYKQEQKVTRGLGISPAEYWNNREEYDYAYDKPEKYALSQAVGGYKAYKGYISDLWDIKADKDKNGKSINGSRKNKVIDYINSLDADYGEKIILFKSEYNADDTYNEDIIDYLNSRDDISYQEMETILKELGFEVDSEGNISW